MANKIGGPHTEMRSYQVTAHVPTNRPGISEKLVEVVRATNIARACGTAFAVMRKGPLRGKRVHTIQFNVTLAPENGVEK